MVDETDNPGSSETAIPHTPGEPTVRLDRVIINGDPTLPPAFGRYKVLDRIGVGGFASVYSAVDPQLQAPVAVKVLAENHSADVEVRRRFVAEARVARRLGSDRLINVFDVGSTDDGRPYVVMELADRGTLRERLNRLHRPTNDDLVNLIEELGACLDAIHRKGVVHRDIKPSNLLLRSSRSRSVIQPTQLIDDDEQLVLADFGLARDISAGASALTVGGGTAGYMAPEQADPSGKADHRADIYAATVVMAEFTTMRHPERLDLGSADLPEPIKAALSRGLSLDREQRPGSASTWRAMMLDAYRADGPTELLDPATVLAEPTTEVEVGGPPPPPPPGLPGSPQLRRPPPAASSAPSEDGETSEPPAGEPPAEPDPNATRPAPSSLLAQADQSGSATVVAPVDEAAAAIANSPTEVLAVEPDVVARTEVLPPSRLPDAKPEPESPPGRAGDAAGPKPDPGKRQPRARPVVSDPALQAMPPPAPSTQQPMPPPASSDPALQAMPRPASWARQALPPPGPASQQITPVPAPQGRGAPPPPARPAPVYRQVTPPAPAEALPAPPASATPLPVGAVPAAAAPLPVVAPPVSTPDSRRESERQSKRHLKTAERLGRLEAKARRKKERKERRRRRRRRIANVFIGLIRGTLASLMTFVAGAVFVSARASTSFDSLPASARGAVGLAAIVAFFLGILVFPLPRYFRT